MKYSTVISLLICALLAFSTANAQDQSSKTITLSLSSASNAHWIAIAVQNGEVDTTAVQMRDSAKDAQWVDMKMVDGHWVVDSADAIEFEFPLSFRLTSTTEQEVVVENIIASLAVKEVDTGFQYSAPHAQSARRNGNGKASSHGRPNRPSATTTTAKPKTTSKPKATTAPTKASATTAPTKASVTTSSTKAAATTAPTKASATTAPTKGASVVSNGKMKMLVPLYMYPGASWTTVAASAAAVQTVAIINPSSGPGNGPDSTYKTYMNSLHAAGVEMIGYVHTSYGARSITDVKADIAKYASEFPLVTGIFIDEAAATADQVSYYTQVHQYIMSMPGYKYNVLNPGAVPTQAYFSISTQIVSFEDTVSKFAASANPSFASPSNADHFAVIAYGATQAQMQSAVATAKSKGYYGWVYFTQMSGASTYNTLSSYYAAMVSQVASN